MSTSSHEVNSGHINSDVDSGALAQHHTLGKKPHQAAPGNHLHNERILCKVYQDTLQSLTNNTEAAINLQSEEVDPLAMHNGSPTTDIVIVVAGRYDCIAQVAFAANAVGYRAVIWRQNGNLKGHTRHMASPTNTHLQTAYTSILCAVGDILTVNAHQTSGGALNTVQGNDITWAKVQRVGDI